MILTIAGAAAAVAAACILASSAVLAADFQAESPGLRIMDNFLDETEIQAFLDSLSSSNVLLRKQYGEGESLHYMGQVQAGPAFLGRLLDAISLTCSGDDVVCRLGDGNGTKDFVAPVGLKTQIHTNTFLEGFTPLHQDRLCETFAPVGDTDVGFVYLNDNEDAFFLHGHARVTPLKGRLVVFDGNFDHQTIVRSGRVSLVGPFLWAPTLDCAGPGGPTTPMPTPAPSPAPTPDPTPAPSPDPANAPSPAPTKAPTPTPKAKGSKKKGSPKKAGKGKGKGDLIV
jgi:hypothetical protein